MTEKNKEPVFFSEDLGAMAQTCIGNWFRICEEATEQNLYHECCNFWFGMRALSQLAIACNNARDRTGAVHFSLALSNSKRDVAKYIEEKIGVNPFENKDWWT